MFPRMKQVENKEQFLQRVVEQLVDGTGSYGQWWLQRPEIKHGKGLTDTGESIITCFVIDNRGDFGWGQRAIEAEEVCGKTSNMRGSRGSSAGGFSLPVIPGGGDVQPGSPDVDGGTIIGEVGLCVIDSRSGDGDRLLNAGG